ncbi:MAG: phosphoglycerate kinase [Candidatus Omnitrophica bacterium]|nr:phosphoglycerate kinase [Candidatus Omnitrophota bacterium]
MVIVIVPMLIVSNIQPVVAGFNSDRDRATSRATLSPVLSIKNIEPLFAAAPRAAQSKAAFSVRTMDSLLSVIESKSIDTAFLACDLNVARDAQNADIITNDKRIRETIPALAAIFNDSEVKYVYAMTHSGRPEGKGFEAEYSLKPIVERTRELLQKAGISAVVAGLSTDLDTAAQEIAQAKADNPGQKIVFVFENIRFYAAEQSKDPAEREAFERKLIALTGKTPDKIAYINEAYSKAHRGDQASMELVNLIPEENRAAGATLSEEIEKFLQFESLSQGEMLAIFGGAKFDKWEAVGNLGKKIAENGGKIIPVGALVHPYLAQLGQDVGKSKMPKKEKDIKKMNKGFAKLNESGAEVLYPVDFIVEGREGSVSELSGDLVALDIGEQSTQNIVAAINVLLDKGEGTLILNGGAGMFEKPEYRRATREIILKASEAAEAGIAVFAVGGDMNTAIKLVKEDLKKENSALKISDKILITTGGGVVLEALDKGISNLKAIAALLIKATPVQAGEAAAMQALLASLDAKPQSAAIDDVQIKAAARNLAENLRQNYSVIQRNFIANKNGEDYDWNAMVAALNNIDDQLENRANEQYPILLRGTFIKGGILSEYDVKAVLQAMMGTLDLLAVTGRLSSKGIERLEVSLARLSNAIRTLDKLAVYSGDLLYQTIDGTRFLDLNAMLNPGTPEISPIVKNNYPMGGSLAVAQAI